MTLPSLRNNIFISLYGKNISLRDLRGSSYAGINVISVENHVSQVHNTKVVLNVDTWKISDITQVREDRYVKRVCFYNRLNLSDIVPSDLEIPIASLATALEFLNDEGYDFTTDDIYESNGILYAKDNSLGYYGDLSGNNYYEHGRLIVEGSKALITTNTGTRILLKENGNAT